MMALAQFRLPLSMAQYLKEIQENSAKTYQPKESKVQRGNGLRSAGDIQQIRGSLDTGDDGHSLES